MPKFLSASEIAALRLPGLPTTKKAILTRAEKEAWHYETRVGLGGLRKVFSVPHAYLPDNQPRGVEVANGAAQSASDAAERDGAAPPAVASSAVAGTIAAGGRADPKKLALAVRALEEWIEEDGVTIDPARKGAIISVLYNYLEKGADTGELADLLKIVR